MDLTGRSENKKQHRHQWRRRWSGALRGRSLRSKPLVPQGVQGRGPAQRGLLPAAAAELERRGVLCQLSVYADAFE